MTHSHTARIAFVVAVAALVAGMTVAQTTPDASAFDLADFVARHPDVVKWVWGIIAGCITALGTMLGLMTRALGSFVRRAVQASERADSELRQEITRLAGVVAEQSRTADGKIDALGKVMLEQWERFHAHLAEQSARIAEHGARLERLRGEHDALHGARYGRRHDDEAQGGA